MGIFYHGHLALLFIGIISVSLMEGSQDVIDMKLEAWCERELPLKGAYECLNFTSLRNVLSLVPKDVRRLSIKYSTLLDMDKETHLLNKLDNLEEVIFTQCYVKLPKTWDGVKHLSSIVFNSSWSEEVQEVTIFSIENPKKIFNVLLKSFEDLPSLKMLSFIGCNLKRIDEPSLASLNSLERLSIIGGKLECGRGGDLWLLEWIKREKVSISESTKCFVDSETDWATTYSFIDKPYLLVLKYKNETQQSCPSPCMCSVTGMHVNSGLPMIHVDCYNVSLTELPAVIPPLTTRCNFSNNNIADIRTLFVNKNYRNVNEMLISHNLITKFEVGLLAKFLSSRKDMDFGIDLSNNLLKTKLLLDYPLTISDSKLVRCSTLDPYFPNRTVMTLDLDDLCETLKFHKLDIVNLCLFLLFLVVIIHFTYNYYQYKKHAKLPWLVTCRCRDPKV